MQTLRPSERPDHDTSPRLILDLNSLLNAALLGGRDPEALIVMDEGGKEQVVNTASYGAERFMSRLSGVMRDLGDIAPRNVIGVWDGENAKAVRQSLLPGYKAGGKSSAVYEQLGKARQTVGDALHNLGAHTVSCKTCEADDTIAYLVQHMRTRRNIVVSGDGDLCVLVDDNTDVYRLDNSRAGVGDRKNVNPFGEFPVRHITLYKALVGDASDKIPGAKGFGDAAFVKLVGLFGLDGLDSMADLIRQGRLQELAEDVGEMKELQKIIDDAQNVVLSWRCASLMPQRVNTLRHPLEWRAGFVKLWSELDSLERYEAFKPHYGTCTLVHAGSYDKARQALERAFADTPFVALDIETSVPEESLAWQEQTRSRGAKGVAVDVLGSEVTGMSLTFGDNVQHTVYLAVDHREEEGVQNITSAQCREVVETIPQEKHIVIHNRAFELPVLFNAWGKEWADNGWAGFVPNAIDTVVGASYVDENLPLGLKLRSKHHLGYTQGTYEEVTTVEVDGQKRQMQMKDLSARHVFGYGCDDTRVTAALHTFFRIIMEMEGTWQTYLDVEQLPEYLTSLAFVQGVPIDPGKLAKMEADDRKALAEHESILHTYLKEKGWTGTQCPVYSELTPASVKEAVQTVLGSCGIDEEGQEVEFSTRKRKLDAVAQDVRAAYPGNALADEVADAIGQGDVAALNALVAQHFTGKPRINFGSPKQMQRLLYDVVGMEPRVFNKLTDKQREDETFRQAFYARRDYEEGKLGRAPTDYERQVWMGKASTDDDAVSVALYRDHLPEREQQVLKSYLKIKELNTRISLFYNTYATIAHWKDGRVHSAFHQCRAATRRYSSSDPNLQQLPSKGDGAALRQILVAPQDYVYVSLDWSGQELRLMAEASQDANMLSCYVGENKRDIHSMVAVQAAPFIWGRTTTYEDFAAMRKSQDEDEAAKAALLRSGAKTTNFATQYGAQAPKVAIQLKTDEATAQRFIDAKDATFPGINKWKARVEGEAESTGLAYTLLGARRHLAESVSSPNSWIRSKAARQASNFWIQGSGAEMAKLTLGRMWASGLFSGGARASFVAPIHDEVVFLVHRDDAVRVIRQCHSFMVAQYADMKVPLASSLAMGRDFSCPVEVGEEFTDEQVQEAVGKLFE